METCWETLAPPRSEWWGRLARALGLTRCWERLYPLGAVWGKHSLKTLPADAICQRARDLRCERAGLHSRPPRVPAATRAASPGIHSRRRRAPQPSARAPHEGLGRTGLALRAVAALPTAHRTMKVTAYDLGCVLQKRVYGSSLRCLRDTAGRKGTEERLPWCVSTQTFFVPSLSLIVGRDLPFFSFQTCSQDVPPQAFSQLHL